MIHRLTRGAAVLSLARGRVTKPNPDGSTPTAPAPEAPSELAQALPDLIRAALFEGYSPHAKQRQLHDSGARFVAVCAGRRSGKTYALAREFLRRVFAEAKLVLARIKRGAARPWRKPRALGSNVKPALHYWVVGPTYALTSAPQQEIFEVLGGEEGPEVIKWNATEKQLWLKGGILIEFKSAEKPERLVSVGLNGLWVDEAARLKPTVWRDNLKPVLDDKGGWALFSTTPLGKNWFYHDIWQITDSTNEPDRQLPGWAAFHFTTRDNTTKPGLIEAAEHAKKVLPLANYLRNYEASFDAFEGKIYENFYDQAPFVIDTSRLFYTRKWAAIDWGYRNLCVLLTFGETRAGQVAVLAEQASELVSVSAINGVPDSWSARVEELVIREGIDTLWCDPSEPEHIDAINAHLAAAGLPQIARAASNSVVPGIEVVGAMLGVQDVPGAGYGTPGLVIDRSCYTLRRELGGYRWRDDGSERPVKTDDHACDALRYGLYSEHVHRPDGLPNLAELPHLFGHVA